ncbi:unnamed protein product [Calypogeia fissa]
MHGLRKYTATAMDSNLTGRVMTKSDKRTFQNVVKNLSDETVVLNKPPFVALLESREEGSRWTTVCRALAVAVNSNRASRTELTPRLLFLENA